MDLPSEVGPAATRLIRLLRHSGLYAMHSTCGSGGARHRLSPIRASILPDRCSLLWCTGVLANKS
jgi:hypothetical protein